MAAVTKRVWITNQKGLHARASAKFVQCAGEFEAEIEVIRDGMSVLGTSIMGLMMLAASKGSMIEIRAQGEDAAAAIEALSQLVDSKFDEE